MLCCLFQWLRSKINNITFTVNDLSEIVMMRGAAKRSKTEQHPLEVSYITVTTESTSDVCMF